MHERMHNSGGNGLQAAFHDTRRHVATSGLCSRQSVSVIRQDLAKHTSYPSYLTAPLRRSSGRRSDRRQLHHSSDKSMACQPAQLQPGLPMPSGDTFPWIGFGTSGIPNAESLRYTFELSANGTATFPEVVDCVTACDGSLQWTLQQTEMRPLLEMNHMMQISPPAPWPLPLPVHASRCL